MSDGRRDLWLAVISQALSDAVSTAKGGTADLHRHQARQWLTVPNRDFAEVCSLADEEPDQVRAFATKLIAEAEHGPVNLKQRANITKTVEKPKSVIPALPPMRPLRPMRPAMVCQPRRVTGPPAKTLTHNGKTRTVTEWAGRLGISRTALFNRIANGWPLDRALTETISPRARSRRESLKRNRETRR